MRFTTIWSLPGLPLKERVNRSLDLWSLHIADHLPKRLAFWVAYHQIGIATMKSAHVPATPLDVVLKNIQNHREGKPIEAWTGEPSDWFNDPALKGVSIEKEL